MILLRKRRAGQGGDLGDPRFSLRKNKDFVKRQLGDLADPRFPLGKVTVPVTGAHLLHLDVKTSTGLGEYSL